MIGLEVLHDLLDVGAPLFEAPVAVCSEDLDAFSSVVSAFHCAGVKASTVAASPLVALVAVPIWLSRSLMRGCSVAWLAGFTRACALAASVVRFGMAEVVAWSASAAMRAAGRTSL